MNTVKERIKYIDVCRGMAAVLVVIGHAVQVANPAFDYNIVFRFIYSFHMPLFMFLSGYVSYKSQEINTKWLCSKAKRLLLPFFVWTILPLFFNGNAGDIFVKMSKVLRQPDTSFWFLLILFYCDVSLVLASKLEGVINQLFKCQICGKENKEKLANNEGGGILLFFDTCTHKENRKSIS